MGIPEGYVTLGLVGFTDKGGYNPEETYMINDLVHHSNTIWKCKKDELINVEPSEGESWEVFINGVNTMGGCTAIDKNGLSGNSGGVVIAQELLDAITDKITNSLIEKSMLSNEQIDSDDRIPTSSLVYGMKNDLSDIGESKYCSSNDTIEKNGILIISVTGTPVNGELQIDLSRFKKYFKSVAIACPFYTSGVYVTGAKVHNGNTLYIRSNASMETSFNVVLSYIV